MPATSGATLSRFTGTIRRAAFVPGEGGSVLARLVPLAPTLAVGLVVAPSLSLAQDSIRPAREIRVVETVDRRTGRTARDVVTHPLPAEILRVQIELARRGHDPRVRSGVLDEPTRRALRRFQIAESLTICGCLTYETVVALGIPTTTVEPLGVVIDRRGHRDDRVIVVVPDGRRHPRRKARRARVGTRANPGVEVGHAPARGGRARRPRPEPPSRIDLPNPPRGRPSTLRPLPPGRGAGVRGARPRP